MSQRRMNWLKALSVACCGGLVLQAGGCVIDPDLILQAGIQFLTELAIFATDNALVNLR